MEEAEKIYKAKLLRTLSSIEFSNLCRVMIENERFRSTILMIIEASSLSLLVRPNCYCIALETLKDIILKDKELNPCKEKPSHPMDKAIAKKLRKKLIAIVENYKDSTPDSFHNYNAIISRINDFNNSTNIEKLRMPFTVLGIKLNDWDLKVIESRNDLLHGRTPDYRETKQEKRKREKLGIIKERRIEEMDNDLWFASNKLYTLLSLLILKYIGFDGYVINYSKKYENQNGYNISEPYFRNQ